MNGPKLVEMPRNPNAADILAQVVNDEGRNLQNVVVMYTTNDGRREINGTPNSFADMLLFVEQMKYALVAGNETVDPSAL